MALGIAGHCPIVLGVYLSHPFVGKIQVADEIEFPIPIAHHKNSSLEGKIGAEGVKV
jgi:hypothetical protein